MIESIFQGKIDITAAVTTSNSHHDNEIAQSLSLRRRPIANYWMHNG